MNFKHNNRFLKLFQILFFIIHLKHNIWFKNQFNSIQFNFIQIKSNYFHFFFIPNTSQQRPRPRQPPGGGIQTIIFFVIWIRCDYQERTHRYRKGNNMHRNVRVRDPGCFVFAGIVFCHFRFHPTPHSLQIDWPNTCATHFSIQL